MKISTLISGSLALVLTATSIAPVMAAPVIAPHASTAAPFEQAQYRKATEEEEQLRRQRRGDGERRIRRNDGIPGIRNEIQRPDPLPRGENGDRRRRADMARPDPLPRGENGRLERRRDDWRRQHRIERRGNWAYFNGHRGYREQRRGYRYYDGFWFPPAAFLLGAIIAGQNNGYRNSDWEDHVDWCYERYGNRYRERDNSYISRDGYRRECVSPYY